jgi:short subunit dehydrogenase-like uncharacterized protein
MAEAGERPYDIVLFGATGFTGALTAEYLAAHGPQELRWALAGRNMEKLSSVRARLGSQHAELPLLQADITDEASIRSVAESARVVITTVGPYIKYGEPLVAACAAAGTDYVDLTGEPEFADLMYLRHHHTAAESGARIVHACGFDSIPYDLGALFTVLRLPEGVPIRMQGFVRAGGTFSGGTYQTAIENFGRLRSGMQTGRERRRQEGRPEGRRVRGVAGKPHHEPLAGGWVVPAPTIDPQIVLRSAAALERYGPDFSYSHYFVTKRLQNTVGLMAGAGALVALSQVPVIRRLLLGLRQAGEGPSEEQRERAWFKVRMVGDGGGQRVICEVRGGDPGYGETAKMLSESALCLAFDSLPERSGQLTPAVAMGEALIDRLVRAGITFETVD